jgi:hypothetical protein
MHFMNQKIKVLNQRKMIDLQHHHNNYTTSPHIGVGPMCGVHPHVKRYCAVVVVALCMNQIPQPNG